LLLFGSRPAYAYSMRRAQRAKCAYGMVALLLMAGVVPREGAVPVVQAQSGPPPPPDVQPPPSILLATPSLGHRGDLFRLSGAHLPPLTRLSIMMACPNWFFAARERYGNTWFSGNQGPRTDAAGQFIGYPVRALALQHLSHAGCHIYAEFDNNPFGPDVPASYDIVSRKAHLGYWDTHVRAEIRSWPAHVRPGLREHIAVHYWPGARVVLSVSFPGTHLVSHQTLTLDWSGSVVTHVDVPAHLPQALNMRALVHVEAHYAPNRASGTASSQFRVTR